MKKKFPIVITAVVIVSRVPAGRAQGSVFRPFPINTGTLPVFREFVFSQHPDLLHYIYGKAWFSFRFVPG